jgi:hypothetical protein
MLLFYYYLQCVGRGGGPPRTTCLSVTNSPSGTPRIICKTTALGNSASSNGNGGGGGAATSNGASFLQTASPGIGPRVGAHNCHNSFQQRHRAKSLTSDTALLCGVVKAPTRPSNFSSLRRDRKKRRSCAGGIMTESMRLWPQGNGDLSSDNEIYHDDIECVTQL